MNRINALIKRTKRECVSNQFQNFENNWKYFWNAVNCAIKHKWSNKSKQNTTDCILNDQLTKITNNYQIANEIVKQLVTN